MTKTFTQNDLIRYIYRETTEKEEKEINTALLTDSSLKTLYVELCELKKEMDNVFIEPSSQSLLNIVNYSRGLGNNADVVKNARH